MKRLEPRQFLPLEIIIWLGPRGFIPPLISSKFFAIRGQKIAEVEKGASGASAARVKISQLV